MGAYINVPTELQNHYCMDLVNKAQESKIGFCDVHGKSACMLDVQGFDYKKDSHHLPVMIVFNGPVVVAAILFNENERRQFIDNYKITMGVTKLYYIVPIEELKKVSNIEDYI